MLIDQEILVSKHTAKNQKTSLKKLSFIIQTLKKEDDSVINILNLLRRAAMIKNSAHILLQAVESCINNVKCELKQKGLQYVGEGKIHIDIGRASCLKRRIFRAKGGSSPIEKHRANVIVTIINSIIKRDEIETIAKAVE